MKKVRQLLSLLIAPKEEVKNGNPYIFKWRRLGDRFWSSFKVVGHKWFDDQNKMLLYLCNGGVYEIPEWTECGLHLGRDWAEATVEIRKKEAEANEEV